MDLVCLPYMDDKYFACFMMILSKWIMSSGYLLQGQWNLCFTDASIVLIIVMAKILNSAWMLNCWSSTINCRSSNFTIILKSSLLTESHLWWNFRLYIKLWIHKTFLKWMLTRGKCNLTLFSPSQTYWLFYFNSSGILSKDYRNHFPIY